MARERRRQAMQTDFLEVQGNAYLDLAEVLAGRGQREAAAEAAQEAIALYERKQSPAALSRAVSRLGDLGVC